LAKGFAAERRSHVDGRVFTLGVRFDLSKEGPE